MSLPFCPLTSKSLPLNQNAVLQLLPIFPIRWQNWYSKWRANCLHFVGHSDKDTESLLTMKTQLSSLIVIIISSVRNSSKETVCTVYLLQSCHSCMETALSLSSAPLVSFLTCLLWVLFEHTDPSNQTQGHGAQITTDVTRKHLLISLKQAVTMMAFGHQELQTCCLQFKFRGPWTCFSLFEMDDCSSGICYSNPEQWPLFLSVSYSITAQTTAHICGLVRLQSS